MSVLIFARPAYSDFFHSLAAESGYRVSGELSEFKSSTSNFLPQRFYEHLGSGHCSGLDASTVAEVIMRDRVLRNLSIEQSRGMVHAMSLALDDALSRYDPHTVLSVPVDNYIRDLFQRKTAERGLRHLAFGDMFLKGYSRIYHRGEATLFRKPEDDEVTKVVQHLGRHDYNYFKHSGLPKSLKGDYSLRSHVTRNFIFRVKKALYQIRRRTQLDCYNWEYLSVSFARDRKRLSDFVSSNIYNQDWESYLQSDSRVKVFVPLHVVPEATIDYWVRDLDLIDYENRVLQAIAAISDDKIILVKEHPGMLGCRDIGFYKRLRQNPNVVIVPTGVPSNALVNAADVVFTWSGSVGFESAVRNKPVAVVDSPYYVDSQSLWGNIGSLEDLCDIDRLLDRLIGARHEIDHHELIRNVLAGTIPAKFEEPGYKDKNNIKNFARYIASV